MFSADVFSADVTMEKLKSTIETYYDGGQVCLVTYTNNKISAVAIVETINEPCVISSGSFNPPHEEHVKVLKTCKDHWNRMNRSSPTCLFELSISNADKGRIAQDELLTRILYFTQPISSIGSIGVCEILQSDTFCVAVTTAAMFLEKKKLLCNHSNSVFCAGIDTFDRIIMPKYYEPVKGIWNNLKIEERSITGITEAISLPEVDDTFYINMLQVPLYVVGRTIKGVKEYLSLDYNFVYEGDASAEDVKKNQEKDTIMKTLKTGEISTVLQQKVTIVTTEDDKPFVGAEVSSSDIRKDPAFEPMKTNIEQFIKTSVQPVTVGGKRIKRKTRKNKRKNKSKSRKNKKRYTYKK